MYNFGYIYSHTAQYTTFILHFCDAYLVGDFISCVCIFQISRSRGTGPDRGLNPRSQALLLLSDELTVSSIALHRASGGGTRAGPGAGHSEQGGRSAAVARAPHQERCRGGADQEGRHSQDQRWRWRWSSIDQDPTIFL